MSFLNTLFQTSLEFVKYTLNPWCVRWEKAMNQQLLLGVDQQKVAVLRCASQVRQSKTGRRCML